MTALPLPRPPRLWRTPRHVDVALTGGCNLACAYCSYGATGGRRPPEDMTTAQILSLFDELGRCGVMSVTLTGGEPLLRPDLREIVSAVVRNRMRFSVNTNGSLLGEDLARDLRDTRRLDVVQVSIDGSTEAVSDRNRGKGAYAGAVHALGLLASLGIPRTVRLTLTRFTAEDLESALDSLLALVPTVSTNEVMPLGRGARSYRHLAMTPEQRQRAGEVLTRYADAHPGRIQASAGPLASAREAAALRECLAGAATAGNGAGYLTSCRGFHSALAVLHDGSIVPCIQMPEVKLGRVGEVPLAELWLESARLQELRDRWLVPLDRLEECQGCRLVPFCRGGCPATALAAHGTHLAPDPVHCLRRLLDGVEPGGHGLLSGRADEPRPA